MDLSNNSCKVILLQLAITLFGASMAANYQVGDELGWNGKGVTDYNYWAHNIKFQVGDKLVFKYDSQLDNVMEVNEQDYESCNSTSPIQKYTTRHDSVELKSCGQHHYYICGVPGHCDHCGQKFKITVKDGNGTCTPGASPPGHNAAPSSTTLGLFAPMLGVLSVVAYTF